MKRLRRKSNSNDFMKSKDIKGFIQNGEHIFSTTFTIFEDGMIYCWELVNIDGFKEKIKNGWVCLVPPVGSTLCCGNYDCIISNITVFENDTEEKILHTIRATIEELNGKDFGKDCLIAFEKYNEAKTEENRKNLEAAYLIVPEQERRFLLGDMDNKDIPIRIAIWGEKEIRSHTHFAVANVLVKSRDVDKLDISEEQKFNIKEMAIGFNVVEERSNEK